MAQIRLTLAGFLCLVLAPVLWGGNFVVGSLLAHDVPGVWMNLFRWCFALILLVPFCGADTWEHRRTLLAAWPRVLILGGLGIAGFNSVLYIALDAASLPMAAIAFSVTPFLIVALAALCDRSWPRPRMVLAAAIALFGMVLAQAQALSDGVAPKAIALVLCAAFIWAAYSVALQRLSLPVPKAASFLAQVLAGTACLVPLAYLAAPVVTPAAFTPEIWVSLGYLGLCAGALAFWLWQHAIAQAGAARSGVFMNLVPISSMLLGAWILGNAVSSTELIAIGIIFTGIAISLTGKRSRGRPFWPALTRI